MNCVRSAWWWYLTVAQEVSATEKGVRGAGDVRVCGRYIVAQRVSSGERHSRRDHPKGIGRPLIDKFTYLIMLAAYGAIIDVALIILNRRKRHS